MLGKKSKEEKIPEVSGEIKNNEYSEAYNFDNNYSSSDNKSREDAFTDEILENYGIVNTAPEPEKKTRKTRRGKKSKEEIITDEPREDFENQSAVSEPEKKTRKERRSKKSKEESAEESSGFDVFASSSETESDKDKKKKKSSKKKAAKDKPENSKKRSQEGDLREEDDRDTTLSGKGSGRFSLFNKKQKGRNKKSEDEEYEEGGEEEYYTSIPEYDYREVGPLVFPKHDPGDTILESYWIEPGLSRISIVRTQDYENVYITHEPALTDFEKYLLERLHSGVRDLLIIKEIRVEDKIKTLYEAIDILIEGYKLDTEIEPETIYKIRYYLKRSFFGWGRIDPLKGDTEIEDISCDGYDSHVFIYHRKYRDMRTLIKFKEPRELDSLVALFAQKSGKHISLANPIVDATLPEGSRIQLTYGTVVGSHGSSFTIRKFRKNPFSPIDLIINGTFTVDQIVYMWMAVEHNHSVLIIGGTASGKTTTLNAMAQFIPALSKVVTIEDTREINLDHENWIASIVPPSSSSLEESKHDITMFDLLKAAMRQRPEYILVGEVRGVETQTLFQAMNTGHTTFSTLHAGDVVAAINRLQNHPLDVPKATIETLDVVISQARMFRNGKQVRRCNEIVEIVGLTETGDLEINQVYTYDPDSDKPYFSGFSDVYATIAKKTNRNKADFDEEINVRKTIISSMVRQEIHDYRDVARIVWLYLSRRDFVIENIDNLKPLLKKGEAMFKTEVSSSKGDSENSSVETYYEQLVDEGKASDEEATSSVSVEMHIIDETSSEPEISTPVIEDDVIANWGHKPESEPVKKKSETDKTQPETNTAYRFNDATGRWEVTAPKDIDETEISEEEKPAEVKISEEPEKIISAEEEKPLEEKILEEPEKIISAEEEKPVEEKILEEPEKIIPAEEDKPLEEKILEEPEKIISAEEDKPAEVNILEEPEKIISAEEDKPLEEKIFEEPEKIISAKEDKPVKEKIFEEPEEVISAEEDKPVEEKILKEPEKVISAEEEKPVEEKILEEPEKIISAEEEKPAEVKITEPEISYYDNPEAFEEEKTPKPLKQPESKTAENYFEYEDEDGIFEIDAPTISDEDRFGKVPEEKKDKDLFEISPASEKKNYGSSFDLYADEPKKGSPKK